MVVDTAVGNAKPRAGQPIFNMLDTGYLENFRQVWEPDEVDAIVDAVAEFRQFRIKATSFWHKMEVKAGPGAGTVYAARLTAAMGTVRDRWTTVDERLCFYGVAPVIERSGQ